MASFAKLNHENVVEQVLSINNNELLDRLMVTVVSSQFSIFSFHS